MGGGAVEAIRDGMGLDFFSILPKEIQEKLENTINVNAWNWK